MVRSRPNVGPSGRAIRWLAAGALATLGMKFLWGQLAPMGSTLLGSGVLAFTMLFGLPTAVSWLISHAVLSAIRQPFAPDRQRRLLWMPFCFIRYTEEHRRMPVHPTIVSLGATVAVVSVVIAFIAGLPPPAVRCQWQPTELRSVSPQEGRRHFEDALDALEQHGVPFVVRNATWKRDLELFPRCGGAKNDMHRQTGDALAIAAQLTGAVRLTLDLFLQLRCWWLDNSACSVDAIRDLFPKTLSEYKRARVAPFGSFAGDRLMHALLPDTSTGFAMLLLDWTFMAIDSDQDYVSPGDGLACTSPAQMLGMPTTADAFAELVVEGRNSTRGARDPLLSGTLDIFLTASAEHHNLLHRHHAFCTGMISVAWQLEGRKGWWLYPPSATAELGPPRVVSGCCETWSLSPSNPPLWKPWPTLSRCWGVELGPGDFLFFRSWPPHFAKPLSPMVSAISHLSACGARRGERAKVLWPQGEALRRR